MLSIAFHVAKTPSGNRSIPESSRAASTKWRRANPEYGKVYHAKWYQINSDEKKAANALWHKEHPEATRALSARSLARRRGAEMFEVTEEDIRSMISNREKSGIPGKQERLIEVKLRNILIGAAAALSVVAATTSTVVLSAGSASASSAGAQFTADRSAEGNANKAFIQAFSTWERSGAPTSQTSSFIDKYALSIEADDRLMLNQSWPAGTVADIDALIRSDATVEGVILSLPDQVSSSSDAGWFLAYSQAAAATVANANIVRHNFGLPFDSFASS
jgi:hypothetical protein